MSPLRVAIVDDEQLAREGLRRLLATDPDVTVVGEAQDGRGAVELIRRVGPDIVLLDIQMPELDGFAVIRAIGPARMPPVVFVTAYESYALEAFHVAAVDYLLKPFTDDRLREAMDRVKRVARNGRLEELAQRLTALLGAAPREHLARFVVKTGDHAHVVNTEDVDWIEAADYCARLHAGKALHVIRVPLADLEQQLDPRRFFRLHRSAMVNLDRVRRIDTDSQGDATVVLADGTRLKVARSRRSALESILGRPA